MAGKGLNFGEMIKDSIAGAVVTIAGDVIGDATNSANISIPFVSDFPSSMESGSKALITAGVVLTAAEMFLKWKFFRGIGPEIAAFGAGAWGGNYVYRDFIAQALASILPTATK